MSTSEQAECEEAQRLATRIAAGDRAAEALLVQHYGRGMLSLLRRKSNDPALAEDLWQDTFRIAIERLRSGAIDDPRRLAGFLRGIAVNLLMSHNRRERRRDTESDTDLVARIPDQGSGLFSALSREQAAKCVHGLLDELGTTRDREILKQYYVDDRDKDEICADLGLDQIHFNRVLFRAKSRFRALVMRAEGRRHLGLVPGVDSRAANTNDG